MEVRAIEGAPVPKSSSLAEKIVPPSLKKNFKLMGSKDGLFLAMEQTESLALGPRSYIPISSSVVAIERFGLACVQLALGFTIGAIRGVEAAIHYWNHRGETRVKDTDLVEGKLLLEGSHSRKEVAVITLPVTQIDIKTESELEDRAFSDWTGRDAAALLTHGAANMIRSFIEAIPGVGNLVVLGWDGCVKGFVPGVAGYLPASNRFHRAVQLRYNETVSEALAKTPEELKQDANSRVGSRMADRVGMHRVMNTIYDVVETLILNPMSYVPGLLQTVNVPGVGVFSMARGLLAVVQLTQALALTVLSMCPELREAFGATDRLDQRQIENLWAQGFANLTRAAIEAIPVYGALTVLAWDLSVKYIPMATGQTDDWFIRSIRFDYSDNIKDNLKTLTSLGKIQTRLDIRGYNGREDDTFMNNTLLRAV